MQSDNFIDDIFWQQLDVLRGAQKLIEILDIIEILDVARRSHRRADLGKAVRKTDAELRPALNAGTLEDRSDFDRALLQVFLPGVAGLIPQLVDISTRHSAHGDDRLIPSDQHLP